MFVAFCYCFEFAHPAYIHFQDVKYGVFVVSSDATAKWFLSRAFAIICKCCPIQFQMFRMSPNLREPQHIAAWHRAACMLRTTHFPHEKEAKKSDGMKRKIMPLPALPINSFSIELCDWSSLRKTIKTPIKWCKWGNTNYFKMFVCVRAAHCMCVCVWPGR